MCVIIMAYSGLLGINAAHELTRRGSEIVIEGLTPFLFLSFYQVLAAGETAES